MVIAMIAIVAQAIVLLVALFERGLRYRIDQPELQDMDEGQFLRTLEAVTDARLSRETQLDVFTNGEQFYEAELAAIKAAQRAVHLEAYIFQRGQVADRFVQALAERARAGAEIRVVLDGVGSAGTTYRYLSPITEAGGKVAFYHALRFSALPRYNNRTHRELLVVDGTTAFVGGAGVADHWLLSTETRRR